MPKYMRLQDPAEPHKSPPEVRLWCAVLKRALDDVIYYAPDTRDYEHAFEWLTIAGDENQQGTLANVVAKITRSADMQETVLKRLQQIVFNKTQLREYQLACIATHLNQFIRIRAKRPDTSR